MATKRLIDANALLEEIERIYTEHYEKSAYKLIHDFFRAMIRRVRIAPTVDAVEVVRCKDCKHYMTIHCTCDGCCISDDWYCADGERKDND